jgi:hypothetical protein
MNGLRGSLAFLVLAALAWGGSLFILHGATAMQRQAAADLSQALEKGREAQRARQTLAMYRDRHALLTTRGILGEARRMDWIEAIRATAGSTGVSARYELAPTHRVGDAVVTETTPVHLSLTLRHEGELLSFLETLSRQAPGVLRVTGCRLAIDADQRLNAGCDLQWLTVHSQMEGQGT